MLKIPFLPTLSGTTCYRCRRVSDDDAGRKCRFCATRARVRALGKSRLLPRKIILRHPGSLPRLPRLEFAIPNGLEQRLRQIARQEVTCDDLSRLYPSPSNRARPRDPAVERHLEHCSRCREIFSRLEIAFAVARPEPTERQLGKWRDIARQSARPLSTPRDDAAPTPLSMLPATLPGWLRDSRFAVAASFVITVLLLLPIGDSSSRLLRLAGSTTSAVTTDAERWFDGGKTRGDELWHGVRVQLNTGYERSKLHLAIHGRSYTKLYDQTLNLFGLGNERRESFVPNQGEHHGRAT